MTAAFATSARTAREMSRRIEADRVALVADVARQFARRDITAETRPKYAARLAELAIDPAAVAALDKPAALALLNTLRALPVV